MNVERFERLTTSVWTLTLPKRVGCAFGMRAASSFRSSGDGFSMTAAASGSRKSILATARILPRHRLTQAVLQNGVVENPLPPARRIAVVHYQLRRARRWLVLLL